MTTAHNPFLPLLAGRVRRYHTQGDLFPQSVAEHCWRASILLLQVYPAAHSGLIRAVLEHDSGEWWAGDSPAPVKWAAPILKAALDAAEAQGAAVVGAATSDELGLDTDETVLLGVLDYLELLMYMLERGSQGIGAARIIYEVVVPFLIRKIDLLPRTWIVRDRVTAILFACDLHAQAIWPAGSPDLSQLCLPADLALDQEPV